MGTSSSNISKAFEKSTYAFTNPKSATDEKQQVESYESSENSLAAIGERIVRLRKLISEDDYEKAFSLCVRTINEFVYIDRASWYNAVLDLVSNVPASFSSCSWYKEIYILKAFTLAEILRLRAHTACLSDFLSILSQVDAFIAKASHPPQSHHADFINEMKLRLFFYLSVYIQRAVKRKRINVDADSLVSDCLSLANCLDCDKIVAENPLSPSVWEHFYTNGLSLKLQSAILVEKSSRSESNWKQTLKNILHQDNLSQSNKLEFEFLYGLTEPVDQQKMAQNVDKIYHNLLKHRPVDLSTILWYILCSPCMDKEVQSDYDLALPSSRIKLIVDTVNCVLPDVPFTSSSNAEICQRDAYVFLLALSVSYLIRFATSPESNRSSEKMEPLSWPNQPLCLLSSRILPSGLQRKCWIELCSRSTKAGRFLEQLRFAKSTHELPSRLALRVAKAISSLNLPSSDAAAQIWEFGLNSLAQNTEFNRFSSPVLKIREKIQDEITLFTNELNSDWWYGTHVENLINTTAKDQVWFIIGWNWLTSHWLKTGPMPKIQTLLNHVNRLGDTKIVLNTETLLSAAKLTKKALEENNTSPLVRTLVSITLDILNTGLINAKKNPLRDETTKSVKEITEAIESLQRCPCLQTSLEQESVSTYESNQSMPSGYGAYSTGPRSNPNFGLIGGTPTNAGRTSGLFSEEVSYRSPRIPNNSLVNASTAAVIGSPATFSPDPQTKLMTQMMEQWIPAFMEFSKVMSETSVELAKSRLQNEELSRMLKDTRSLLDDVIAEQRKQQQQPPAPSPVKKPEQSSPSLEDWRALQESLNEVTATLKDLRKWLPNAFPPLPPPPLSHFIHPPPPIPVTQSVPQPADMFNMLESQKAQMALSQLLQQQQRQMQQHVTATSVPSCMLPQPPHVPPVDLRVPPPSLFPAPAPVQQPSTLPTSNLQQSPLNPVKTSPIAPVKPPVASTFSSTVCSAATNTTTPATLIKSPTTPPAAQESSGSKLAVTGASTSRPEPFSFLHLTTTASSSSNTALPSFGPSTTTTTTTGFSSSFSFGSLAKSMTSGQSPNTATTNIFGGSNSKSATTTGLSLFGTSLTKPIETSAQQTSITQEDEDKPEAFEPNVDFKPCVEKLPELVEPTTGEENEKILFCNRARLFRWDKPKDEGTHGEWKARGVGELKILCNEETNKYRVVMRRDQVMKLCANHYILPGTNIKRHPQKSVACMWNARDFAVMDPDQYDPNGTDELFMVTFKTQEITDEFEKIVREGLENATSKSDGGDKMNGQDKTKTNLETKSTEVKTQLTHSTEKSPLSGIDAFKAKPGSWTCSCCLLVLDGSKIKCPCCNSLKPGASPPPSENTSESKVTFGLPSAATSQSCPFNFLAEPTTSSTPNPTFIFGTNVKTDTSAKPPTFGFGNIAPKASTTESSSFGFKPALCGPSTSDKKTEDGEPSRTAGVFGGLNLASTLDKSGNAFTFTLNPLVKPADQATAGEMNKSSEHGDGDDEEVAPSDLSQVTFKPIIDHLPDKVEVVTGEEGEDVLFEARAKLFRFDSGDGGESAWKERGLGQLKILKDQASNRVRLVMRREQVHKVCCNHLITPGMTIKPMDGSKAAVTPWVWWAVDFSEEEAESEGRREMLSVRFKTAKESQDFHDTFVKCAERSDEGQTHEDEGDDSEVEVVENPLSPEQIQRARALMLPDDFYAYELKEPGAKSKGESEELSPSEEAAEDALLETAIGRGISRMLSSTSSFDVVKSTESLVITTPPVSPPVPQTETPKSTSIFQKSTTDNASATSTPSAGGLFGSFLGSSSTSGGVFGGFGALSKDASSTPSWLKPKASEAPSWAGADTALFSNTLKSSVDKENSTTQNDDGEDGDNEPDPQFEPLIPLPSLVEARTGEEDEVCLFLRRCKLYRLVDNQWKERGIGDMKILVRPKNNPPAEYLDPRTELPTDAKLDGGINYARILMRRDQVLKICANHTITADMPNFKPLAVTNYGLLWAAKDFSEEVEGEIMTLGLKFKTEQDLTQFKAAIARAREMLKGN
nr:E3 SUMO protein ligase RanBP2 [Hymenolepis microstoma]